MKNFSDAGIALTGIGVTSGIGQGKSEFAKNLLQGHSRFDTLQRAGRQHEASKFIGAEIGDLDHHDISPRTWRSLSLTAQVGLITVKEAYEEAKLHELNPLRVGLIVGGSNVQQREHYTVFDKYLSKPQFVRPNHAISFMDSDLCGVLTAEFGIQGMAMTVGGASSSGQLAVIKAAQAVSSGQVDVCIAVGALMDLSCLELQAFRTLGAMGSTAFSDMPNAAARPFDANRDGFIYGEACGAVVIESSRSAESRGVEPYAMLVGMAEKIDANRNPDPSLEGEVSVIKGALKQAKLNARDIDYINPHGTGSIIGDETELQAFRDCDLRHAHINSSKSIIGHGLTAAGCVELVATLLQMQHKQLHPCLNLQTPIDETFNWVSKPGTHHTIKHALLMSMGFGGFNTAICLERV